MNYSNILFSREHLAAPFTINRDGKEISIKDKKIQTVAAAIFTVLLKGNRASVRAGVVLFYCLSAKYKLDKVGGSLWNANVISSLSSFFRSFAVTNIPRNTPYEDLKPLICSSPEQEIMHDLVAGFLHPFITGQITEITDSEDREPMIEWVEAKVKKIPELKELPRDEIEEMALDAFFLEAVKVLYVMRKDEVAEFPVIASKSKYEYEAKRAFCVSPVSHLSPQFELFINALVKFLPKEFANRELVEKFIRGGSSASPHLRQKAFCAVRAVNEQINSSLRSK
jgi:hypothetical protein